MAAVEFAIIGGGWRSEFFLRIARALPEHFSISGVLVRNREKGEALERQFGVNTCRDLPSLLARRRPAFVVVSVPQPEAPGVIGELADRGLPILTETPPAPTLSGLLELWALVERGAQVQVAEQYMFQPLHAARLALARSDRLGDVTLANVSACHGYHGTSLIRHFLGIEFENATVIARVFESDIVASPGRAGPPADNLIERSQQVIAQLDFGSRLGIYDFTGDQYFSWIRSRSVLLRGSHGEIRDTRLTYLFDHHTAMTGELLRQDNGQNGNLEGLWHKGIVAGSEWVYTNPFAYVPLSDDEIAVATVLSGMQRYVETGEDIYSFAEAAQDQLLSLAIDEAVRTGEPVTTQTQPWASQAPGGA